MMRWLAHRAGIEACKRCVSYCQSRSAAPIYLCLLTGTFVQLGNRLLSGPDTPRGRTVAPPRATAASGTPSSRKQRAHALLSADGVLFAIASVG